MKEEKLNSKINKSFNLKPCNMKVVEPIEKRRNLKMSRMEVSSIIA